MRVVVLAMLVAVGLSLLAHAANAEPPPSGGLDDGLVPKKAEITLRSEKGEYIGGGSSYRFKTPRNRFYLVGTRKHLEAQVPGRSWGIELARSDRRPLGRGLFRNAKRYPFDGKRAGLTVRSPGRECGCEGLRESD